MGDNPWYSEFIDDRVHPQLIKSVFQIQMARQKCTVENHIMRVVDLRVVITCQNGPAYCWGLSNGQSAALRIRLDQRAPESITLPRVAPNCLLSAGRTEFQLWPCHASIWPLLVPCWATVCDGGPTRNQQPSALVGIACYSCLIKLTFVSLFRPRQR